MLHRLFVSIGVLDDPRRCRVTYWSHRMSLRYEENEDKEIYFQIFKMAAAKWFYAHICLMTSSWQSNAVTIKKVLCTHVKNWTGQACRVLAGSEKPEDTYFPLKTSECFVSWGKVEYFKLLLAKIQFFKRFLPEFLSSCSLFISTYTNYLKHWKTWVWPLRISPLPMVVKAASAYLSFWCKCLMFLCVRIRWPFFIDHFFYHLFVGFFLFWYCAILSLLSVLLLRFESALGRKSIKK